jgi:hypothetical protein
MLLESTATIVRSATRVDCAMRLQSPRRIVKSTASPGWFAFDSEIRQSFGPNLLVQTAGKSSRPCAQATPPKRAKQCAPTSAHFSAVAKSCLKRAPTVFCLPPESRAFSMSPNCAHTSYSRRGYLEWSTPVVTIALLALAVCRRGFARPTQNDRADLGSIRKAICGTCSRA